MTGKPVKEKRVLVAMCGLYCGACRAFLKGRCKGCIENTKATWCSVRKCCLENKFASCAECAKYDQAADCKKFNNFVSKIFGVIFRSDRAACVEQIKQLGLEAHAQKMDAEGRQSIRKK